MEKWKVAQVVEGINSSKVYCKVCWSRRIKRCFQVLIVAKCIVRDDVVAEFVADIGVLIVAKCIVRVKRKKAIDDIDMY